MVLNFRLSIASLHDKFAGNFENRSETCSLWNGEILANVVQLPHRASRLKVLGFLLPCPECILIAPTGTREKQLSLSIIPIPYSLSATDFVN